MGRTSARKTGSTRRGSTARSGAASAEAPNLNSAMHGTSAAIAPRCSTRSKQRPARHSGWQLVGRQVRGEVLGAPAMPEQPQPSSRALVGIAGIMLLIVLWGALVAAVARFVGEWPILVQALFYLVMGLIWIVPLKP